MEGFLFKGKNKQRNEDIALRISKINHMHGWSDNELQSLLK